MNTSIYFTLKKKKHAFLTVYIWAHLSKETLLLHSISEDWMTVFTEQRLWMVTLNLKKFVSSTLKRSANPDWYFMDLVRSSTRCHVFPVPGNWHCVMHSEARRHRHKLLWSRQGFFFLFHFATVNFCLMKIYHTTLPTQSFKEVVVWRGCFFL